MDVTDTVPIDLKDPRCFETIYNTSWKRVYSMCYKHTGNTEVSKEMVQDIFKSLWERREELTITVSVERYLARAARYKVFEYIRNKATQQLHAAAIAHELPTFTNATEDDVNYSALQRDVEQVVESLPDQCRRVFRLSRMEGLTNREIAARLEVSERAVEHHITRALRSLRQTLLAEPVGMV